MATKSGLTFRPHACPRCHGDAYFERHAEDPEWRCLQCGRVVPDQQAMAAATAGRRAA